MLKQTLALVDSPPKDNSPVVEMAYSVESSEEGVFSITTNTRYNAEGNPLMSVQKLLISNLSDAIESKSLTIDERNLTSTQWLEYHTGTNLKQLLTNIMRNLHGNPVIPIYNHEKNNFFIFYPLPMPVYICRQRPFYLELPYGVYRFNSTAMPLHPSGKGICICRS